MDKESALQLSNRYKLFILRNVGRHNGLILEPPDVSVPLLLERSIKRRKPFNQGDKGFRDTLIWLNTLQLVKEHHRVSFISANTTDYAKGDSLHPDLEEDLTSVLPGHISFRYFKSLNEFIAFMDRDSSSGTEALRNALMSEGYRGFKLEQWVLENIETLFSHNKLDGVSWTALPYWAEDPRLIDVEDLVGIEVHGEHALENDRVEFFCDISLVGTFQCSILYASWKSIVHPLQVQWIDEESSDIWTEVGVRSVGTFLARIVFDLDTAAVINHELIAIPHDIAGAKATLEELEDEFGNDDQQFMQAGSAS